MDYFPIYLRCKGPSCKNEITMIGDVYTVSENVGKRCPVCKNDFLEINLEKQNQKGGHYEKQEAIY